MVEDLSGCIIRPRVVQQAGKGKSQFTKWNFQETLGWLCNMQNR